MHASNVRKINFNNLVQSCMRGRPYSWDSRFQSARSCCSDGSEASSGSQAIGFAVTSWEKCIFNHKLQFDLIIWFSMFQNGLLDVKFRENDIHSTQNDLTCKQFSKVFTNLSSVRKNRLERHDSLQWEYRTTSFFTFIGLGRSIVLYWGLQFGRSMNCDLIPRMFRAMGEAVLFQLSFRVSIESTGLQLYRYGDTLGSLGLMMAWQSNRTEPFRATLSLGYLLQYWRGACGWLGCAHGGYTSRWRHWPWHQLGAVHSAWSFGLQLAERSSADVFQNKLFLAIEFQENHRPARNLNCSRNTFDRISQTQQRLTQLVKKIAIYIP